MRGKGLLKNFLSGQFRITPAYAGKSHQQFEKCYSSGGSPPPMRGKVVVSTSNCYRHRITPAYAGKRNSAIKICIRLRDHPRLCGEKVLCSLLA